MGGGHSKHHFHAAQGTEEEESTSVAINSNNKRAKIFTILRSSFRLSKRTDIAENESSYCKVASSGGHEVCIDIVSKALHCYICDDYIISDASWLQKLRGELIEIENHRDAMDISSREPSTDEDDDFLDAEFLGMINHPLVDSKPAAIAEEGKKEVASRIKHPVPLSSIGSGITGLDNLGNTCYMNSVLQMLSHCSGFRSFFRDFLRAAAPLRLAGEGKYTLARQSTSLLINSVVENDSPEQLDLSNATHALLRVLWSGRWRSISPRYFVNAVWKHSALFAARKQQDANEFLNFYLGRLDDELKPSKATNGSVMMDLFGIEQYQEVKCDKCGTLTKKTEPLLGLVLSLPDEEEKSNGSCHIQLFDCFKSLQSTGLFVGENQFFCDQCNAKEDAKWKVVLQRRPQSLLISLRRTLWNKAKGVHKDSRRVEFPIELDASDLLAVGNEKGDDEFDGCLFTLKALVSHSGKDPFVGHYIAYARSSTGWYLFNDSSVTSVTESNVLDAEAYILLYERRTISGMQVLV